MTPYLIQKEWVMGKHDDRYESRDDDHHESRDDDRYESHGNERYESRNDDRYESYHAEESYEIRSSSASNVAYHDDFYDDADHAYEYSGSIAARPATQFYSFIEGELPQEKYAFSIQNGQVVGVFEMQNGRLQQDVISSNETYVVSGLDIIKYESSAYGLEQTRYSDVNKNGIYTNVEHTVTQNSSVAAAPNIQSIELVGQHIEDYGYHHSGGWFDW